MRNLSLLSACALAIGALTPAHAQSVVDGPTRSINAMPLHGIGVTYDSTRAMQPGAPKLDGSQVVFIKPPDKPTPTDPDAGVLSDVAGTCDIVGTGSFSNGVSVRPGFCTLEGATMAKGSTIDRVHFYITKGKTILSNTALWRVVWTGVCSGTALTCDLPPPSKRFSSGTATAKVTYLPNGASATYSIHYGLEVTECRGDAASCSPR